MKYITIKRFMDGSKARNVGDVLTLDRDRAKKLLGMGKIEPYIEQAMLEEKTEKAVKRTRKKKVVEEENEDRHLQEQGMEEDKA